jgi:hypothetical protein
VNEIEETNFLWFQQHIIITAREALVTGHGCMLITEASLIVVLYFVEV